MAGTADLVRVRVRVRARVEVGVRARVRVRVRVRARVEVRVRVRVVVTDDVHEVGVLLPAHVGQHHARRLLDRDW